MSGARRPCGFALLLAISLGTGALHAEEEHSSRNGGALLIAGLGLARSDVEQNGAPREGGNPIGLFALGRYVSEERGRSLAGAVSVGLGAEGEGAPAGVVALGANYGLFLGTKAWPRQGLYARGGAEAGFDADPRLRSHWVDLPTLEAGYGLHTRSVVAELGGVAALEIVGADVYVFDELHRSKNDRRFSATFGGRSAVLTKDFAYEVRLRRTPLDSGNVDRFEMLFCGASGFIACFRFDTVRTAISGSRLLGYRALMVIGVGGTGTFVEK